ncbi:regulator of G-protein signaling 2 isoform X2 [Dermacentor silvarum]|nr:regulator of G-protein signaling 2 isoform X2 [Dermacentor silvarum]
MSSSCITSEPQQEKLEKLHKNCLIELLPANLLRRRPAPSVRPTPEEAKEWARSFRHLTASKYGLALFHVFLAREYSEENIEFWLACEELKTCRPNKLSVKAQRIFDEFIAPHSPKEVNLDALTRAEVTASLTKRPDRTCLDLAQRRVQGLLERDAYLRFLQCDLYQELCRPPAP